MFYRRCIIGILAALLLAGTTCLCMPVLASDITDIEPEETVDTPSDISVENLEDDPTDTPGENPEGEGEEQEEPEEPEEPVQEKKINSIYVRCTPKLYGGDKAVVPAVKIESVGPEGVDKAVAADTAQSCWINSAGTKYKKTASIKAGNNTLNIVLNSETAEFSPECEVIFNGEILDTSKYTAEGKNLQIQQVFKIPARTSVSKAKVKLSRTSYVYNGKEKKPKVTVKVGTKTLTKGIDYKVTWKNNKKAGKASCIITGINTCTGKKTVYFTINRRKINPKVQLSSKLAVFDGNSHAPKITVVYKDLQLRKGRDYKVFIGKSSSSDGKKVGRIVYIIRMIGNYKGMETAEYKITPAPTSLVTAERVGTRLRLVWRAQKEQISGYQIQYSIGIAMWKKARHNVDITDINQTSVTLKVSNHVQYARIRTFKNVGKTRIYSEWSMVRKGKPPQS